MECIEEKFFVTGPNQHNRLSGKFCKFRCFNSLLGFPFASESTTNKRCNNPYLFDRETEFAYYTVPQTEWRLSRSPHCHFITFEPGKGSMCFYSSMCQIRIMKLRIKNFIGNLTSGFNVSVRPDYIHT